MKAVITTINPPTEAVKRLAECTDLIVIGDRKTPKDWKWPGVEFVPIENQNQFNLSALLPENHYCRKNIGYLIAMAMGADLIYDTDDDNIPNENWRKREKNIKVEKLTAFFWTNVYQFFSTSHSWPRGFPLTEAGRPSHWDIEYIEGEEITTNSYIQQGLADDDPDVDAIYRMILGKQRLLKWDHENSGAIMLDKNNWCPFNSQSTWFFREAFPLLYLPVYATFRMTDIWRSFVAQRCLWEMGGGVTFHSPAEVYQKRNQHDLMKDFEQEIPGYLHNEKIAETLTGLQLTGTIYENMVTCYEAMIAIGVLPKEEMNCLKVWISDVTDIL